MNCTDKSAGTKLRTGLRNFLFISIWAWAGVVCGQYYNAAHLSGVGLPYFAAQVFPTFTPDGKQPVIRIYLQLTNDDLSFIKSDSGYYAQIEVKFSLSGDSGKVLARKSFKRRIIVATLAEAHSHSHRQTFYQDFPLDSGRYEAKISVRDQRTRKRVVRTLHFAIPSFHDVPLRLSNILFFTRFKRNSVGKIVRFTPNLSNNFESPVRFFYMYFQTVVLKQGEDLFINYRIKDSKGNVSQENSYVVKNSDRFKEHFIRLNRRQFDQNRYIVELSARAGDQILKSKQIFTFYWTESPKSPRDLDFALQEMEYIAPNDSLNFYRKASFREKKKFFDRFWAKLDPKPETRQNEMLDEYFRRVNFANQNFSSLGQTGWRTDMGRIFIKFGPPEDVERHPFEMGSRPYEIWRYYGLNKVFLFIDRTGFGDYYLPANFIEEEFN